jgi:hypothetical protein
VLVFSCQFSVASGGAAGPGRRLETDNWQLKTRKYFFFEKKKQKTFTLDAIPDASAMAPDLGAGEGVKVFWFFFSKKNCFLPFQLPVFSCQWRCGRTRNCSQLDFAAPSLFIRPLVAVASERGV